MLGQLLFLTVFGVALCAPTATAPSIDTLAQSLFQIGDANHDGIYTRAESWANVLASDRNGDNKISLAEYISRYSVTALENLAPALFTRLDTDQSGFIEERDVNRVYIRIDADSNGQVSMVEFTSYVKAVFTALMTPTTSPAPTTSRSDLASLIAAGFPQTDRNQDGFVSFDEQWADAKQYDINGDDKVSKVEFMQVVANLSFGLDEQWPDVFDVTDQDKNGFVEKLDVAKFFQLMDADQNGLVSKAEMVATYQNLDQLLPGGPVDERDYGFETADTNGDGMLTLDEEWANTLLLDNNTDNKVSLPEFLITFRFAPVDTINAAKRVFRKYDHDSDGYFEKSDIAIFYNGMDANGDGRVSRNVFTTFIEVMFANEGADIRAASAAVDVGQNSTDRNFAQIDTNNDNLISVDEQWTNVLLQDKNGDKKVSKAEYLTRYANRPANIKAAEQKVFAILDFNKDGFLDRTDVARDFPMVDISEDGFISLNEYSDFVKKLQSSLGIRPNSTDSVGPQDIDYGFSLIDSNSDGRLTLTEEWSSLLRLDRNGDNQISKAEYLVSFEGRPPSIQAVAPQIFSRYDYNRNGFLELFDIDKAFPLVDTSGNGFISFMEYATFVNKLYASFGINLNITSTVDMSDYGFSGIDTDGDGQVTFDEEWTAVKLYDSNDNNQITRTEYLNDFPPALASIGPKIFAKFDSDKNGYFDKDDIRKLMTLVDTNGDRTLSSSEYSSFARNLLSSLGVGPSPSTAVTTTPA